MSIIRVALIVPVGFHYFGITAMPDEAHQATVVAFEENTVCTCSALLILIYIEALPKKFGKFDLNPGYSSM